LTLDGIWDRVSKNEQILNTFETKEGLDKKLIQNWLITGVIKKGRAVDRPQFKSSGFELDVRKAYKNKLPYTVASLNPLPPLLRTDYIAHLFIYHKCIAYELFPEKYYPKLDIINQEVAKLMDSDYVQLTNLFNKTEEEKIIEIENEKDPIMREMIEERLVVMDNFIKKHPEKYTYPESLKGYYKTLGHDYYLKTIAGMKRQINEAIL
jgi:hypothetical protein